MRETEILRGLSKAKMKHNVPAYAAGMVPNRPHSEYAGLAHGTAYLEGPGTGTSDSIPAMLSRGEAVLPAATVRKVGADNIAELIKDTNGAAPARGLRDGGKYVDGTSPTSQRRMTAAEANRAAAAQGTAPNFRTPVTPEPVVVTPNPTPAAPAPNPNVRSTKYGATPNYPAGQPANPLGPDGLKIQGTPAPTAVDDAVAKAQKFGSGAKDWIADKFKASPEVAKAKQFVSENKRKLGAVVGAGLAVNDKIGYSDEGVMHRKFYGDPNVAFTDKAGQAGRDTVDVLAGVLGGAGGGAIGGAGGAFVGGGAGTAVAPGPGTVAGTLGGGFVGGVLGANEGSELARTLTSAIVNPEGDAYAAYRKTNTPAKPVGADKQAAATASSGDTTKLAANESVVEPTSSTVAPKYVNLTDAQAAEYAARTGNGNNNAAVAQQSLNKIAAFNRENPDPVAPAAFNREQWATTPVGQAYNGGAQTQSSVAGSVGDIYSQGVQKTVDRNGNVSYSAAPGRANVGPSDSARQSQESNIRAMALRRLLNPTNTRALDEQRAWEINPSGFRAGYEARQKAYAEQDQKDRDSAMTLLNGYNTSENTLKGTMNTNDTSRDNNINTNSVSERNNIRLDERTRESNQIANLQARATMAETRRKTGIEENEKAMKARADFISSTVPKIEVVDPKTGAKSFVDDQNAIARANAYIDGENISAEEILRDPPAYRAKLAKVLREQRVSGAFNAAGTGNLFGKDAPAGAAQNLKVSAAGRRGALANGAGLGEVLYSFVPFTNKGMVEITTPSGERQVRSLSAIQDVLSSEDYAVFLDQLQSSDTPLPPNTIRNIANGRK